MLSEMNQKLSQAARLYDQLLTAHVSPVSVQSPPVQQYYTAPAQQYVPPQPQQYAQYNTYGPSAVPTYNSSTHVLESAPSAPTPTPATQSYERPMSGPSTYSHPITIQPQYYPPPVLAESHPTSPPTAVPLEVPAMQPVPPPPPVQTVASPPPAPPILQSPQRSGTVAAVQPPQQPLSLPSFPSVPNEPLPMPLVPQHIEQQPQKEAMLISFD